MAKLSNYKMNGSFEIEGLWSLDYKDVENGINGVLFYSDKNITLQLSSVLEEMGSKNSEVTQIFGMTQDGKLAWLKDCKKLKEKFSAPGYPIQKYSVLEFFLFEVYSGAFEENILNSLDVIFNEDSSSFKVEKAMFSTNQLQNWIDHRLPIESIKREDRIQLILHNEEDYVFKINSNNLSVSPVIYNTVKPTPTEWKITQKTELKIEYLEEVNLKYNDYIDSIEHIKKLFELLMDTQHHFNYVDYIIKSDIIEEFEESYPITTIGARHFFTQIGERYDKAYQNKELSLNSLGKEFENIIDNWFDKDALEQIVSISLNDLYNPYFTVEKLVNTIRDLEAFSRDFLHDTEEHGEKDNRGLKKKLKDVIYKVPDDVLDVININKDNESRDNLINILYDTRNYYIHLDEKENHLNTITDLKEAYEMHRKVTIIQLYIIFTKLEIPEKNIISYLEEY